MTACSRKCHFYDDQSGVYEGRDCCNLGHNIRSDKDCIGFIDQHDKLGLLQYLISETQAMIAERKAELVKFTQNLIGLQDKYQAELEKQCMGDGI